MVITPTFGPPRSTRTKILAITAAVMLTIMALTQLFRYEDLATILTNLLPFNDQPAAHAIAAVVVLAQVLALPYLLGMYLSRLMRLLSATACLAISAFWLLTSLTNAHAQNAGFFSSIYDLPGGLLAAAWSFLLFGCVATVAYADSKFRHDASS